MYALQQHRPQDGRPMNGLFRRITDRRIFMVLVAGFALVFTILLLGGLAGVRNLKAIQVNAGELVKEHQMSSFLVAQIQLQLTNLNAVIHRISRDPKAVDAATLLEQIDRAQRNISRISAAGRGSPEENLWNALDQTSHKFSAEARNVLGMENRVRVTTRELVDSHEDLITIAARLFNASYWRSVRAQTLIDQKSQQLVIETVAIMGGCTAVAFFFTLLTLLWARRLMNQQEARTGEIGRVSFHLLQDQEGAARRFSHELHDELGQGLTAIKANLVALGGNKAVPERVQDCLRLVDESIENVRQMSQLLHPRILDDFGLETALRWLGENFARRQNIDFQFNSNWSERLSPDAELHLFRIAQEALTNVARHSKATEVHLELVREGDEISMTIADNGKGLRRNGDPRRLGTGIGLIAMRARAENIGGTLRLDGKSGEGCRVRVQVPLSKVIE